jgi:hypothetical protein
MGEAGASFLSISTRGVASLGRVESRAAASNANQAGAGAGAVGMEGNAPRALRTISFLLQQTAEGPVDEA